MSKVRILNGPNLNMLGIREPDKYGTLTLTQVESLLTKLGFEIGIEVEHFQSNHEGQLIDAIQSARDDHVDFLIINPGALTHTSVGLRDAFLSVELPFIEVHISNVHAREDFRRKSYLSDIAVGTICGFGVMGYELALQFVARQLDVD